ncbi:unnamed protein product [Didymodactylos carnosus]|uniref:Uncharacterized protein n=1 Tax=Didymodactylos carnosus TaxID=1234261 RepID=A0A814SSV7_9BILA|nr:unnamed protein product [Didymodactylos carnosus]CAF1333858.1 unnamed protein product [Didymodactylos carnosus]CAF3915500.1 unnamed protein product [Didymodactylos carnosus]CAF4145225.1 unnamed protein product [Didymodactylos carnosus]
MWPADVLQVRPDPPENDENAFFCYEVELIELENTKAQGITELLAAFVRQVDIIHQMDRLSYFLLLVNENYLHFTQLYVSTIQDLMTQDNVFNGDPLQIMLHIDNIEYT